MKTLFTAALLLVATLSFAQKHDFGDIMNVNWRVGKEKEVWGHLVTKVEGRNNMYGFTNVGYDDHAYMVAQTNERAEKEMWTPEKKAEELALMEEGFKGGLLTIYLGRLSIEGANTEHFTVIIKDSAGNEVLRKQLDSQSPELPRRPSPFWTNIGSVNIDKPIETPFNVYVIDEFGGSKEKDAKFHFLVNKK